MNNPDRAGTPPLPQKQPVGLLVLLRWLLGGIAGYMMSLYVFFTVDTFHPPLLEPIIIGQVEFFNNLFYNTSLDNVIFVPLASFYGISGFMYSLLWGLTGSLLASGRKKQISTGLVLLILYIVLGGVYYMIWALRMMPT
jgi:hypothetical protein